MLMPLLTVMTYVIMSGNAMQLESLCIVDNMAITKAGTKSFWTSQNNFIRHRR